jgi:hypothetical protein
MQNLLFTKMLISLLSALTFIVVLALSAPNVHADVTYMAHDNNINNIQISISQDNHKKRYQVNGRSFYWHDLSKKQQAQIKIIEDKINNIEKSWLVQEKQLTVFTKELENKVRVIEDQVSKLERVGVKLENENINDIYRVADKLATLSAINEAVLRAKYAEIQEIEQNIDQVDFSLINDIERHARELETLLIKISESL